MSETTTMEELVSALAAYRKISIEQAGYMASDFIEQQISYIMIYLAGNLPRIMKLLDDLTPTTPTLQVNHEKD